MSCEETLAQRKTDIKSNICEHLVGFGRNNNPEWIFSSPPFFSDIDPDDSVIVFDPFSIYKHFGKPLENHFMPRKVDPKQQEMKRLPVLLNFALDPAPFQPSAYHFTKRDFEKEYKLLKNLQNAIEASNTMLCEMDCARGYVFKTYLLSIPREENLEWYDKRDSEIGWRLLVYGKELHLKEYLFQREWF